jgi:fumarate reductase flavoprotein subunit
MTGTAANVLRAGIVIVGAGGAGLAAAAAAVEAGVTDVLIVEKAAAAGGNTALSAGMFAVGSPAQRRKGIEVSAGTVFREKMAYANWRVDPKLTRVCIERSGDVIRWLETKGMFFDSVVEFLREGEAPKVFHLFSPGPPGFIGKRIVDTLAGETLARGVRMLTGTPATGLLLDETGAVRGLRAVSSGEEVEIDAPSVILATGGFGANPVLLDKYFPGHGDVFTKGCAEVTGDGLAMAEAVDAVIDDNRVLLVTGPHHYPWSHVLTLLVRRPEVLLVNARGERYCDETIFLDLHTEAGNALSRQPGMVCYALLDATLKDRLVRTREIVSGMERKAGGAGAWVDDLDAELEAGVARGTVKRADTWPELARLLGADAGELDGTVRTYNLSCDRGLDEEFLKEARFLQPLRVPPYYAVLGRQGFDTTLGGIKIDHRARVTGRRGGAIPGLYAAGDCASGWEHCDYNLRHPGSALTFALCTGIIAGQEAASFSGARPKGIC